MNKSAMVCATRVPCFARKVQSASTLKVVPSAFRLLLSAASLRELQNKQRHVTAINRRVYKASESDRRAIEQKRLDFIAHWYACMRLLP